jgi:hypothetical protein
LFCDHGSLVERLAAGLFGLRRAALELDGAVLRLLKLRLVGVLDLLQPLLGVFGLLKLLLELRLLAREAVLDDPVDLVLRQFVVGGRVVRGRICDGRIDDWIVGHTCVLLWSGPAGRLWGYASAGSGASSAGVPAAGAGSANISGLESFSARIRWMSVCV